MHCAHCKNIQTHAPCQEYTENGISGPHFTPCASSDSVVLTTAGLQGDTREGDGWEHVEARAIGSDVAGVVAAIGVHSSLHDLTRLVLRTGRDAKQSCLGTCDRKAVHYQAAASAYIVQGRAGEGERCAEVRSRKAPLVGGRQLTSAGVKVQANVWHHRSFPTSTEPA